MEVERFDGSSNVIQPNPLRCLMISSVGVGGSSRLIRILLTLFGGRAGFKEYEDAKARVRSETDVPFIQDTLAGALTRAA